MNFPSADGDLGGVCGVFAGLYGAEGDCSDAVAILEKNIGDGGVSNDGPGLLT